MTPKQAEEVVALIQQLASDIALRIVYEQAGDDEWSRADERKTMDRLEALLTDEVG